MDSDVGSLNVAAAEKCKYSVRGWFVYYNVVIQ